MITCMSGCTALLDIASISVLIAAGMAQVDACQPIAEINEVNELLRVHYCPGAGGDKRDDHGSDRFAQTLARLLPAGYHHLLPCVEFDAVRAMWVQVAEE